MAGTSRLGRRAAFEILRLVARACDSMACQSPMTARNRKREPSRKKRGTAKRINGPTGKGNRQRQGLVSALSGEGGPLNILGGIPTINLDYSPMWRLFPAVWTEEAIQKGYRSRMTSALQAAEMSHRGYLKSLDGGDFRAVGFIVNCPVVYRIN